MTYFNEEMIRKIRDKELDRKMETLVSYLLEKILTAPHCRQTNLFSATSPKK